MEDEELVEELIFRSAPGAALPEKGLDLFLSSEKECKYLLSDPYIKLLHYKF